MTPRFHELDDAVAILTNRGVYRQAKLYRRGEHLFAAHGAGFIGLYAGGGTSVPHVRWSGLDVDPTNCDPTGRLMLLGAPE